MPPQLPRYVQTLRPHAPEFIDGTMATRDQVLGDGALDAKTKLLILFALDLMANHEVGTRNIANRARAAGATEAEIMETIQVCYVAAGTQALSVGINAFQS